MTLGAPEAFNGLLTRAVSGNGLWKVAVSANEGEAYKDNAAYNANFTYKSNPIAYALQEADGFATTYNLSFKYDNSIDLTAEPVSINDEALATLPNTTPVTVGEMLTVEFDNPQKCIRCLH